MTNYLKVSIVAVPIHENGLWKREKKTKRTNALDFDRNEKLYIKTYKQLPIYNFVNYSTRLFIGIQWQQQME